MRSLYDPYATDTNELANRVDNSLKPFKKPAPFITRVFPLLFKRIKAAPHMKKWQFSLPAFALLLALIASAFTGKPDATTAQEDVLYWYTVTYDQQHPNGIIESSDDLVAQDEKSNVTGLCPSGSAIDCLRGFAQPLSTFPSEAAAQDEVMRTAN